MFKTLITVWLILVLVLGNMSCNSPEEKFFGNEKNNPQPYVSGEVSLAQKVLTAEQQKTQEDAKQKEERIKSSMAKLEWLLKQKEIPPAPAPKLSDEIKGKLANDNWQICFMVDRAGDMQRFLSDGSLALIPDDRLPAGNTREYIEGLRKVWTESFGTELVKLLKVGKYPECAQGTVSSFNLLETMIYIFDHAGLTSANAGSSPQEIRGLLVSAVQREMKAEDGWLKNWRDGSHDSLALLANALTEHEIRCDEVGLSESDCQKLCDDFGLEQPDCEAIKAKKQKEEVKTNSN